MVGSPGRATMPRYVEQALVTLTGSQQPEFNMTGVERTFYVQVRFFREFKINFVHRPTVQQCFHLLTSPLNIAEV